MDVSRLEELVAEGARPMITDIGVNTQGEAVLTIECDDEHGEVSIADLYDCYGGFG
jgi:hypothetical protein